MPRQVTSERNRSLNGCRAEQVRIAYPRSPEKPVKIWKTPKLYKYLGVCSSPLNTLETLRAPCS